VQVGPFRSVWCQLIALAAIHAIDHVDSRRFGLFDAAIGHKTPRCRSRPASCGGRQHRMLAACSHPAWGRGARRRAHSLIMPCSGLRPFTGLPTTWQVRTSSQLVLVFGLEAGSLRHQASRTVENRRWWGRIRGKGLRRTGFRPDGCFNGGKPMWLWSAESRRFQ